MCPGSVSRRRAALGGWCLVIALAGAAGARAETPPTAEPRQFRIDPGRPLFIDLLAYASDADGDPLTIAIVRLPAGTLAATGSPGVFLYEPQPGVATDSFRYRVGDGRGGSAEAEVDLGPPAAEVVVEVDATTPTFLRVDLGAATVAWRRASGTGPAVVAIPPGSAANADGLWNAQHDYRGAGGFRVFTSSRYEDQENAPRLRVTVGGLVPGQSYRVFGRFVTHPISGAGSNGIEIGWPDGPLLLAVKDVGTLLATANNWQEREVDLGVAAAVGGELSVDVDDDALTSSAAWSGLRLVPVAP